MRPLDDVIRFYPEEIIAPRSLFGRLIASIGIESRRQVLGLLALCTVPLVILSAAALHDDRFWPGSLTIRDPEHGIVLGMSFIGDTMVWPMTLTMPLLVVFIAVARRSTNASLNKLAELVDPATAAGVADPHRAASREWLRNVKRRTVSIFDGGSRPLRPFVLFIPWGVAILMNCYNGFTCFFRPDLPSAVPAAVLEQLPFLADPYATSTILVRTSTAGPGEYSPKPVTRRYPIPKWDTDRHDALASAALTRLWALIFYTLPGFVMLRLILMVIGFAYFLRQFSRWASEHAFSQEQSIIKPFAVGSFSGLDYLSETAVRYFYVAFGFLVIGAFPFFKEGISLSTHNRMLLVFFMPIVMIAFITPMLEARRILRAIKMKYLAVIGSQQNEILFNLTADRYTSRSLSGVYYKFMSLKEYNHEIARMRVWPFRFATLAWLFACLMAVPVLTIVGTAGIETSATDAWARAIFGIARGRTW